MGPEVCLEKSSVYCQTQHKPLLLCLESSAQHQILNDSQSCRTTGSFQPSCTNATIHCRHDTFDDGDRSQLQFRKVVLSSDFGVAIRGWKRGMGWCLRRKKQLAKPQKLFSQEVKLWILCKSDWIIWTSRHNLPKYVFVDAINTQDQFLCILRITLFPLLFVMISLKILFYQMEEVIEDIINMESSFNDEGIGCSEIPLLMQRTVSILWNFILLFIIEKCHQVLQIHSTLQRLTQYYQWTVLSFQLLVFLSRNITGRVSIVMGYSCFNMVWIEFGVHMSTAQHIGGANSNAGL